MIERYSLPKMRSVWTEQRKLEIWLEIETLACEAMAELGSIPKSDAAEIRAKGAFDIETERGRDMASLPPSHVTLIIY